MSSRRDLCSLLADPWAMGSASVKSYGTVTFSVEEARNVFSSVGRREA
jgi:hypothetical protein